MMAAIFQNSTGHSVGLGTVNSVSELFRMAWSRNWRPYKSLSLTFMKTKEQWGVHQAGILTFTLGRRECRAPAHLEKAMCGTRSRHRQPLALKRGINHVCSRTLLKYCK